MKQAANIRRSGDENFMRPGEFACRSQLLL